MRNLTTIMCLTIAVLLGSANKPVLSDEKIIYIHKQPEFDIWYHAYPDYYYGENAREYFWFRYQIRGYKSTHKKCVKKIQFHFLLIYGDEKLPIKFEETCPWYAVTGDRGFPLSENIQKIIEGNSKIKTKFIRFEYIN